MKNMVISPMITRRKESETFETYLSEVSRIPMITVDEEVELSEKIKKGDNEALNKLVSSNLRFVISVAKQYQDQGLSLSDLINEGNIGLITAAKRFDPTRGFKFITYGVWWIRQSITQALSENSRIVRLPVNQISKINKVRKLLDKAGQENQREPNPEDILSEEFNTEDIYNIINITRKSVQLDMVNDDGVSIGSLMADTNIPMPDCTCNNESMNLDICDALKILTEKEAAIIKLSFGIGQLAEMSTIEIADRYDMTPEAIRQIIKRSLSKMKKYKGSELQNYL